MIKNDSKSKMILGKLMMIIIMFLCNLSLTMANSLSNDTLAQECSTSDGGARIVRLKTNLLYDACLIPNIGIDVAYTDSWSVSAGWHYADFSSNRRHRYWQSYGGELEVRRWLSPTRKMDKQGSYAGVYLQGFNYDVEINDHHGFQSDHWHFALGLSYGYSAPISSRLNLDFNIGVGYLSGKYYKYYPDDGCYVWSATKHLRYFGPTKVGISLGWLIYKNRKGGWR